MVLPALPAAGAHGRQSVSPVGGFALRRGGLGVTRFVGAAPLARLAPAIALTTTPMASGKAHARSNEQALRQHLA